MDSEINSQSDAQLKDDATDQQPDAQPIDSETNPQSSAQLEAMGFASFGQKHKRPKHHHGNSSLELAPASLPKKPPASISPPTETGQTNKNQGPSGQSRHLNNNPGVNHGGDSSQSYYSRRFVDNPWETLERRMGILVGKGS